MLLALSYVARSIFYLFFRRNKNEFVSGIRGDPRCAISCVLGGPQKLVRKLNRQNFWGEIFGEEWHRALRHFLKHFHSSLMRKQMDCFHYQLLMKYCLFYEQTFFDINRQ